MHGEEKKYIEAKIYMLSSECDFNAMLTGWEASKPRCTCDLSSLAVNLAVELMLVH